MKLIKVISIFSLLLGISIHAMDSRGMHEQALTLSPKKLEQKLRDNPLLLNQQDSDGKTLLMVAIAQGNASAVKNLLVHFNPDPWLTDDKGEGAFHYVCKTGNLEIARMLLNRFGNDQAEWKELNKIGSNFDPIADAQKSGKSGVSVLFANYHKSREPLFRAILLGKQNEIEEILKQNPKKINQLVQASNDQKFTPLVWAIQLEDDILQEYLRSKGASVEEVVEKPKPTTVTKPNKATPKQARWIPKAGDSQVVLQKPKEPVIEVAKTQEAIKIEPIKINKTESEFDPHQLLYLSGNQLEKFIRENPNAVHARDNQGKTILQLAVESKNLRAIKMLAKNANPWIRDNNGGYAFRSAVETTDLSIIRTFLKTHADDSEYKDHIATLADIEAENEKHSKSLNKLARVLGFRGIAKLLRFYHDSTDPLFRAVMLDDRKAIEEICKREPDRKNKPVFKGYSPLMWAALIGDEQLTRYLYFDLHMDKVQNCQLSLEEYRDMKPNVSRLLENELKMEIYPNRLNQDKLFDLMQKSDLAALDAFLKDFALIDNTYDRLGITPIEYAVKNGRVDLAKVLIDHNVDLDNRRFERPLLLTACLQADITMMRFLARWKDVDINFKGSREDWPFNFQISERVKQEIFRFFDIYHYARLFEDENLQLELTNATLLEREELIDRALSKGARINELDCHGNTALHWACTNGNPSIIAHLIKKGADLNLTDKVKGRNGLRWLLRMHKKSVRKDSRQITTCALLPCFFLLMCAGADPNVEDIHGHSVLDWIPCQGFSAEEKELIDRIMEAKKLSKDQRKKLLEDIYEFQLVDMAKPFDDNEDVLVAVFYDPKRRLNALVKETTKDGLVFKDIYKEYIE